MRPNPRYGKKGMTIIELALAMSLSIAVSAALMVLVRQQLTFLTVFNVQSFLVEEAPMISMHVSRITGKADRFRLHGSVTDALNGTNARLTESPVLLMTFQQPDGTTRSSMLVFETRGGVRQLNYYLVPSGPSPVLGTPQWSITKKASDIRFTVEQGILRMTIDGTAGERIVYSGTMQQ